ncbi:MAG: VOC family protein [Lewinellaceae bacterium]|nr:VOC family protein [Lewinellaceae bacterium]
MTPFHYAFKVKDIASTRAFYADVLGCQTGRFTETWIDFDFFGHQLSAHISDNLPEADYCGLVDGVKVPIPHFGCVLSMTQFEDLEKRLSDAGVSFLVPPQTRYPGQAGEQRTMFVLDYSGNPLEFKAFVNPKEMFAR